MNKSGQKMTSGPMIVKCLSKKCERTVSERAGLCDPCRAKVKANSELATAALMMVLATIRVSTPKTCKTVQFYLMPDDMLDQAKSIFEFLEDGPASVDFFSMHCARGGDMRWMP